MNEPERLTVALPPGMYEQLSAAAEKQDLWLYEFLDDAFDKHEATLRAKGGVQRHRRRRSSPALRNAQLRLSPTTNRSLRQLAIRHDVPLSDVVRALVTYALGITDSQSSI